MKSQRARLPISHALSPEQMCEEKRLEKEIVPDRKDGERVCHSLQFACSLTYLPGEIM